MAVELVLAPERDDARHGPCPTTILRVGIFRLRRTTSGATLTDGTRGVKETHGRQGACER